MTTDQRWILAKHRLRDDVTAVVALWLCFAVFVFAVVLVVAALRSIQVSGWEIGSQIPRWFAGGVGVYLTAVYLPLYVAHGYTRREAARQLSVATAVTVVLLAVLMTLGYAIERAIYAVAGWPQALQQDHLFAGPTDYGPILLEFLLLFVVWAAAGALAGAAIYRGPANGLYAVPLAVVMVGLAEAALNPGFFEFVTAVIGRLGLLPAGTSVGVALSVTAGCLAVAVPVTWLLVRDLPLRSPSA